jgi:anti-sigma B factor antagonist
MKWNMRRIEDVVVFDLKGPLEGAADSYRIKDEIKARLNEGSSKFLLNMAGVDFVNSTGVGIIASAYSTITSNDGVMKICGANSKVSKIFMITKLLEIFDSYYDEDDALKSFR